MTISGQGDLTTYQAVSDELKFTPDAYTKVDSSNNQKVSATTVYDVNDTYKADYPQKITSLYPDYVSADVAYSWNEDKIGGLFYTTDWGNTWKAVQSSDKVDLGNRWEDGNEYSKYSTTEDKSGRILMADFKKGNYYTTSLTNVTFKSDKIDNLYVVSDNKYVKLAADAKYKDTESYYYFLGNWSQYREINEADLIRMGYLEHPTETLAEMLKYKLTKSNTFETIKFVNTGTGAMTIDKDIVKAILYPSATANSVLTTLDLGAATCKDFSKETFAANGAQGYSALETLTLPLNESKETPAQVFFYLQGQNFKLTHVIVPEGYGKIGANTFETGAGVNLLTNVTLPNSLTEIGEKAFLYAGKLASIELGANLTYIGKEAFVGTGLTSISFPENLDKIDDGAFYGLNITNLVFNEKLRFIGNSAFALTSEQTETVLMIPASVKYIGPFAFNFRQYQDVYFQGTKAPLMPVGKAIFYSDWGEGTAFSAHTLMGNSGFEPSPDNLRDDAKVEGFANRENYKSSTGVYFCIMHYPSSTSDEDAKDFTDTSRMYETCPEGGTWDYANTPLAVGKEGADPEFKKGMSNAPYIGTKVDYGYQDTYLGRQYIWPSQSQWVRSYIVNSYGYNWDGVTKYRSNLTEEDYATLKEAGFVVGTGEGQYTEDELRKIAHMGTRRFVLVNGDSKSTPEYKITMKPGQWWTLCVPFNMTKKQVLDTFGADTQLCLFNKVTRDLGVNGKNKIVLYFTQDVLKHSTKNADGTKMKDANGMWSADIATAQDNVADDDVVLWAHESYMIKPYNGEQSNQDAVFVVKNYEAVEGNPLPTVVQSATTVQSRQASETKEYRFVGNYLGNENARATKVTIPQYSYVYANTKSDPVYKFRFYTGNTSTWKPNKSLVQTNDRNGGRDDYNNFFGIDKSTPLPAGSKQASVFGGENFDETTGIEDVTIVAGTDTLTPVFNLEGKMVSSNGDAAGLPAGIYVKNGQKFMVK